MIKTILVLADGNPGCEAALSCAVELGRRFGAHLDVLHVRADQVSVLPFAGEAISARLAEELMEAAEKTIQDRTDSARSAYDRLCPPAALSTAWHVTAGRQAEIAAAAGRVSDLVIIERPEDPGDVLWRPTVELVLFDTGRPVLILPRLLSAFAGDRVAVAWNGSAQAAHAIAASLPFLRAARQVVILSAGPIAPYASTAGLIANLGRHGIQATACAFEPGTAPLGPALLEQAHAQPADLLVMGAYSHSWLREMILGGTTRQMLALADLPVLMAH
jgi:nucleotide-binding universal stress UspA family protein